MKTYVKKRKITALLLAIFMMLSLLPLTVSAEEPGTISVNTEEQLRAAVTTAENEGSTIRIDADIILTSALSIGQSVTLTSTDKKTLDAEENKITINAGVTFDGDLVVTGSASSIIDVKDGASFTLGGSASVTQTNSEYQRVAIDNKGTLIINGGTVSSVKGLGIRQNGGSLTVTDGKIEGATCAINRQGSGSLNVSGGEIISAGGGLVIGSSGDATISGGSITSTSIAVQVLTGATVDISSGTFTGTQALSCSGTANITGGSFTGKVSTTTDGILNIISGNVNLNPTNVSYHDSHYKSFLDSLPAPIDAQVGKSETMPLTGVEAGLSYSIDYTKTSGDLGASISSNTVSIKPTAAGNSNLVLTATANNQTLNLTVPVVVTGAAGTTISMPAIEGVAPPATGATPVTSITGTEQYTGTVSWSPEDSLFAAARTYTASIILTPKTGYSLSDVSKDFFTVAGATATNDAGSGVVTAVFPPTESAAGMVCAIGEEEYPTLDEALEHESEEYTITLLQSITHTSPVEIDGKSITFALGNFNLTIDTSAENGSTALKVINNGIVDYDAPGTFTVCGGKNGYGVWVQDGSRATVREVQIKTDGTIGAYAWGESSQITVNGDIKTVGGEDALYDHAVGASAASMAAKITVNGSLSIAGNNATGAKARDGGEVEVNPPGGGIGVLVKGFASVGVDARNAPQSRVTVNGDVEVQGDITIGAHAVESRRITINGNVNVTGNGVNGVRAETGEGAGSAGGAVSVTGSIVLTGTDETNTGIYCFSQEGLLEKSAVTVDGSVTAPVYLELDGDKRGKESSDGTDAGYAVYTGQYGSVVKVGNSAGPSLPTVTTTLVNPVDVTATGARVRGAVTASGGAPITAFGFAWGLSADPTTTVPGTGTAASFTADLSGLVPNQTYYVRAYATNSVGTAYGENRTFTTASSDPLAAPLNLRYLAYDGAVELIWDAPSSASEILRYEIMPGNDLTQPWTDVGNVTSHRVTGLVNGEKYTFNIRAVNAEGPGAHDFLWVEPNIPTPPGPPHFLSASGSSGKVRVSWSAPYYNGHREITGYLVSLDYVDWIDVGLNRSYEFTGLTNGVAYTFYVRAANEIGTSETASVQGSPRSAGGSGSSDNDSNPSATPPAASQWLERSGTPAPIAEAKEKGLGYILTRRNNQYGVRAAAWVAFSGYQYWHDTMDGSAVQVRVYIKNPTAITSDLLVSGHVKGAEAERVKTLFEKYFANKVRTIHLDQTGAWGQSVEIAAKVDLTGMDITKLMIYSYDKATNTYRRIEKPAYWVDKNGYLHFTTQYAGDIVISEGPLALKNGGAK